MDYPSDCLTHGSTDRLTVSAWETEHILEVTWHWRMLTLKFIRAKWRKHNCFSRCNCSNHKWKARRQHYVRRDKLTGVAGGCQLAVWRTWNAALRVAWFVFIRFCWISFVSSHDTWIFWRVYRGYLQKSCEVTSVSQTVAEVRCQR